MTNIIPDMVGILQIISGVQLIRGVNRIHQYFKDKQGQIRVNTNILLLHAGAFGLYLLSDVVVYSAYSLYVWVPTDFTWEIYGYASIFYVSASFLSQVLLCAIFWDLGKPMD